MTAAIDITPASGNITAKSTVCRIDVSGQPAQDESAFDATKYPTEPEILYYLAFELGGEEYGRSPVFGVTPVGAHQFNNYIFPEAGSWTVNLRHVDDDSSEDSISVTVS